MASMKMSGDFSQSGSRMSQQGDVDGRRTDSNFSTLERAEVLRMGKVIATFHVGTGPVSWSSWGSASSSVEPRS